MVLWVKHPKHLFGDTGSPLLKLGVWQGKARETTKSKNLTNERNKMKKKNLIIGGLLCLALISSYIGISLYKNSEGYLKEEAEKVCESKFVSYKNIGPYAYCMCDIKETKRVFDDKTYKEYLKAIIKKDAMEQIKLEYTLDTMSMYKLKAEHNKCLDGVSKEMILKSVKEYEEKQKRGEQ